MPVDRFGTLLNSSGLEKFQLFLVQMVVPVVLWANCIVLAIDIFVLKVPLMEEYLFLIVGRSPFLFHALVVSECHKGCLNVLNEFTECDWYISRMHLSRNGITESGKHKNMEKEWFCHCASLKARKNSRIPNAVNSFSHHVYILKPKKELSTKFLSWFTLREPTLLNLHTIRLIHK